MICWIACVSLCLAQVDSGEPASDKQDRQKISIALDVPRGDRPGTLEVRISDDDLQDQILDAVPESIALPTQKFGKQLIYRDVRLTDGQLTQLTPEVRFKKDAIHVTGTPKLTGNLRMQYEHVWMTKERREVKIFGKTVVYDVPVVRREWREKSKVPLTLVMDIEGDVTPEFQAGETLNDARLILKCVPTTVLVKSLKLDTDDKLLQLVQDVIGVTGKAFPNEGFNKAVKDKLTQTYQVDPFAGKTKKDRKTYRQFQARNIEVRHEKKEWIVTAELTLVSPKVEQNK